MAWSTRKDLLCSLDHRGTGKTLLARSVGQDLGGRFAHLTFPSMPAGELMAYLADELECPGVGGNGLSGSIRRLRAGLAASVAKGSRPVLIVDEAHLIDDPATFETLRLLLNFATTGPPDLSLLLVGAAEVLLRMPPALLDRLTARCVLTALPADESAAYVLGRLEASGAKAPLFDSPALLELHRAADGLPRRLNRLADLALLVAYASGAERAGVAEVQAAAREADYGLMAA